MTLCFLLHPLPLLIHPHGNLPNFFALKFMPILPAAPSWIPILFRFCRFIHLQCFCWEFFMTKNYAFDSDLFNFSLRFFVTNYYIWLISNPCLQIDIYIHILSGKETIALAIQLQTVLSTYSEPLHLIPLWEKQKK